MANIEEVRAGIAASNEKASEALGVLSQAHASMEEAQAALARATEGSGQADATDAVGMAAQIVSDIEELRQKVSAFISANEGIAGRL